MVDERGSQVKPEVEALVSQRFEDDDVCWFLKRTMGCFTGVV